MLSDYHDDDDDDFPTMMISRSSSFFFSIETPTVITMTKIHPSQYLALSLTITQRVPNERVDSMHDKQQRTMFLTISPRHRLRSIVPVRSAPLSPSHSSPSSDDEATPTLVAVHSLSRTPALFELLAAAADELHTVKRYACASQTREHQRLASQTFFRRVRLCESGAFVCRARTTICCQQHRQRLAC